MNKAKNTNKVWMVKTLKGIESGSMPSYYHLRNLHNDGYLTLEKVNSEGRGRPSHEYVLSGKACGYLAFARKWNATKHLFDIE